jgi:hypothetical protein
MISQIKKQLEKQAGLGSKLLTTATAAPVLGAGVGALSGATMAEDGSKLKGALIGAGLGAGLGTAGAMGGTALAPRGYKMLKGPKVSDSASAGRLAKYILAGGAAGLVGGGAVGGLSGGAIANKLSRKD